MKRDVANIIFIGTQASIKMAKIILVVLLIRDIGIQCSSKKEVK
ncbi:hypothetical protein [Marinicella gelatinilytica]|nr:hypothetical protein [Marinicella gelatinilytica]MCX7545495.1 hypothetical protein [Marinicella gelatinilytica]